MRIDIITIFPSMFEPVLNQSIIKRAQGKKKVKICVHNLRDYTPDKHRKVDDRPFGGGSGMVMNAEPIFRAVEKIKKSVNPVRKSISSNGVKSKKKPEVVLLCPQGEVLSQKLSNSLSRKKHLILICGRYEGVDERVRQYLVDREISIGDYVLTGGELPAMVLVDSIIRLIPGVLGDKNSLNFESFIGNLLEYPQYTRPANFRRMRVPGMLLTGNHKKIEDWRRKEAIKRTRKRRPDLLDFRRKRKEY